MRNANPDFSFSSLKYKYFQKKKKFKIHTTYLHVYSIKYLKYEYNVVYI